MKPRFIFLHGNQTEHWSFGWASWLKTELERLGFETFFETMPDSIIARSEYWLPFIKDHIGAGQNDIIIGWSSGAVAAMRYAEEHKIKGSILVSPSYTDLGDELERQSGYFTEPWNWQDIRANQEKIAMIWGDDDPYIPQSEFAFITEHLKPDTLLEIPEGEHFVERHDFPELLHYIQQTYAPESQN